MTDPEYLTVAEIATTLRTSKMTIYRLAHSGELASVRVGRSFRVTAAALAAYLNGTPCTPDVTPANGTRKADQHAPSRTQEGGTSDGS